MPYEFYLSIDAHEGDGVARFASALIEKSDGADADDGAQYRAHALKRYVDLSLKDVVDDLLDLIADAPFTGRTAVVTNVGENAGRDVHEQLRERGISPITVAVTGGDTSPEQGRPLSFAASAADAVQTSEREIVSAVEKIYRSGRIDLEIIKDGITSALVTGLEDYQVEADDEDVDPAGAKRSLGAEPRRPSDNADLVLAAGLACWLAEQQRFDPTEHLAGKPPPVREAKRDMRPDTG